jgi:hypothetical protein
MHLKDPLGSFEKRGAEDNIADDKRTKKSTFVYLSGFLRMRERDKALRFPWGVLEVFSCDVQFSRPSFC